jgi:glycosyltransferase involved in cell wall biosynthesis
VPFTAMLVGDGPDRAMLEARATALGVADAVQFLGERPDVERLLPGFDVFVLSSREEGIPNALLEAMAAGRPAVVTDVGGNREVLRDGDTGWIVPAQSPARSQTRSRRCSATPPRRAGGASVRARIRASATASMRW